MKICVFENCVSFPSSEWHIDAMCMFKILALTNEDCGLVGEGGGMCAMRYEDLLPTNEVEKDIFLPIEWMRVLNAKFFR